MSVIEKSVAPPLDLQLGIADAAAALYYLALRRAVWLGAQPQVATDGDRDALAEIGTELEVQFRDAERHAELLRGVFARYGPWCDERIADALATGQFGEPGRAAFARFVQVDDGSYADRGAVLASGLFAPSLTFDAHDVGCGLVAVGAMGGMLTCPKTAGAGCALAAGCLIVLGQFC